MKTYLLLHNGKICAPKLNVNQRGFWQYELEQVLQDDYFKDYNIICIEEEIKKYHLDDSEDNVWGLNDEVYHYKLWLNAYINNNLNNFSLPLTVESNSVYRKKLEQKFEEYINFLNRPAFIYESSTIEFVKEECKCILKALDSLIGSNKKVAENMLGKILDSFQNNIFLVSDLDKSYSFRGIAPFVGLQNKDYSALYETMMNADLTFYRVRTKPKDAKEDIADKEDILHLPYNLREKACSMRFTPAELPGLYLGSTTFICSKEVGWNKKDELYASVFVPNDKGKKFKILNMAVSQALINGIYNRNSGYNEIQHNLQNAMLKIFPLVMATSFSVQNEEKEKHQYLISQELMRCASKNGIDGIAYLSMKGDDEFQYPQGINLAIPATDISENNLYSEKCSGFKISKPIMYCKQTGGDKKSYINNIYTKQDPSGVESFPAKVCINGKKVFYGDTSYGKFDDYLVSTLVCDKK